MADSNGMYRITLLVCGYCRTGFGDVCHTPGCAFWMKTVPENGFCDHVQDFEEAPPTRH